MSSQISCPKCGKVNDIKNIYCIDCGFQFEGNNVVVDLNGDKVGVIATIIDNKPITNVENE